MSENEKKNDGQNCCCCKCWARIFITITLLIIGAVIGHIMTERHHCSHMMGPWGGCEREMWRDRCERECQRDFDRECRDDDEKEVRGEHKGWFWHKGEAEKCRMSEPNKASCPMMYKKEGKFEKD